MTLARARARQRTPGQMNRLESAYSLVLEAQKRSGKIQDYRYEAVRLKLGNGAWYKPDFYVIHEDGTITMDECKGFEREAAMVRLKVAASLYPELRFRLVKRAGSAGWNIEEVEP